MIRAQYNNLEDLTSVAEFVVEASSFEMLKLWEEFHEELNWQECARGWVE